MPKVCYFTGKRKKVGGSIVHRGLSKKKGGIGLQLVKNNKRTFKPNLQKVKIVENGKVKKVWASAKAIRSGLVKKA
ncbi:MAG: 50S ribosomal protein L28 [Lentisphaeria bacterium]|nr:50S ribosomal protein L28 [Lentisphaeria bacterium]